MTGMGTASTRKRARGTSYGQMNQWQNYMTDDWTTNALINRQAALSPVMRRPQPPSPHHGVSSTRLLSVAATDAKRLPQPTASKSYKPTQSESPRYPAAPEPQRILIPINPRSSLDIPKPPKLEPLNLNNIQEEKQEESLYEQVPTGRRTKPRKKIGPIRGFQSEDPAHLQYYQSGGYDDYHKTYLKLQQNGLSPRFPHYGPPKLRAGNAGGSWRHVRQVLQAGGSRRLFVDGQTRIQDNNRILHEEVPGGNILQPVAQNTNRKQPKPMPWTAHQLRAFKASEGQNYMIMR